MKLNRPIALTGSYGKMNTGDDALLLVSAWGAQRYWGPKAVGVLSRNCPKYYSKAKSFYLKKQYFRGQSIIELLLNLPFKSFVVYGGGSIFNKVPKNIFSKNNLILMAKKLHLIRIGAVGVSIGPFKNNIDRQGVADYLSHFDFLSVRDERSYHEACAMNLPFMPIRAFDLAALLPFIFQSKPKASNKTLQPILGVSLCHYERYVSGDIKNETRREEKIESILHLVLQKVPVRLRFLIYSKTNDTNLAHSFANKFKQITKVEIVEYNSDTKKTWDKTKDCTAVLATRLHAGIFSCFSQVPFLQIEYHPKCSDFLDEIGYAPEWRIGDMDDSIESIADKITRLISGDTDTFTITNKLQVTKRALSNFISVRDKIDTA